MALENGSTSQRPRFFAFFSSGGFFGFLPIFPLLFFPGALFAQSSSSSSATSGSSPIGPVTSSVGIPNQVQTSAQNPVFGSVPEDNTPPGILSLTFSDAIERALRQNLAGLLSQYNSIEVRG